jgi:hypothetical protein
MEVTCYSETSVDFQRTTRHHIQEDSTLLRIILFQNISLRYSEGKIAPCILKQELKFRSRRVDSKHDLERDYFSLEH